VLSVSDPSIAIDEVSSAAHNFRPMRNSASAMLANAARDASAERFGTVQVGAAHG
jgi:hypothetical protein